MSQVFHAFSTMSQFGTQIIKYEKMKRKVLRNFLSLFSVLPPPPCHAELLFFRNLCILSKKIFLFPWLSQIIFHSCRFFREWKSKFFLRSSLIESRDFNVKRLNKFIFWIIIDLSSKPFHLKMNFQWIESRQRRTSKLKSGNLENFVRCMHDWICNLTPFNHTHANLHKLSNSNI